MGQRLDKLTNCTGKRASRAPARAQLVTCVDGSGRRGAVLVATVVCLLVAMVMGAALLRSLAIQHRHGSEEEMRLQSLWLAESAISRAASHLQNDATYAGETWEPERSLKGQTHRGSVVILVEPIDRRPDQRLVRVEARWPDDPLHRSIHRKQVVIHLAGEGDST